MYKRQPTWVLFLVIYVLTKIFYNASLVFYDSMLVDVTTKDRMDAVSYTHLDVYKRQMLQWQIPR